MAAVEHGAEGESCEANDHCASGLSCVDLVCRAKANADGGSGTDGGAECRERQCVEVGCQSDPQCFFLTRDEKTRCAAGQWVTGCSNDIERVRAGQACVEGSCAFVGRQSDAECREALGLADGTKASCRLPE